MDRQEFSYRFDILYNNISSNAAPGLNEYEKSVFLTKAQDELVKNYFNAKGNKYREGFEETEKRKMDFSTLLTVKHYSKGADVTQAFIAAGGAPFDNKGVLYEWPGDLLFVANEAAATKNRQLSVVPVDNVSYLRLASKPFKYPTKTQCWRMVHTIPNNNMSPNSDKKPFYVEIITSLDLESYTLRYIRYPYPIILNTVGDRTSSPVEMINDLSINGYTYSGGIYDGVNYEGVSDKPACELDDYMHEEILQRAVELAKVAYMAAETDANVMMSSGQRSE